MALGPRKILSRAELAIEGLKRVFSFFHGFILVIEERKKSPNRTLKSHLLDIVCLDVRWRRCEKSHNNCNRIFAF